jgi:hypothetical protein
MGDVCVCAAGVLTLKDATDIDLSWSRGIDDTGYWAGSVEVRLPPNDKLACTALERCPVCRLASILQPPCLSCL